MFRPALIWRSISQSHIRHTNTLPTLSRRRDRVGKVFVCLMCDWEMDRQINAGLNILKTALASNEALARAVRFQPGALRHDVVSPLYDLFRRGTGAREEPSGVESRPGRGLT